MLRRETRLLLIFSPFPPSCARSSTSWNVEVHSSSFSLYYSLWFDFSRLSFSLTSFMLGKFFFWLLFFWGWRGILWQFGAEPSFSKASKLWELLVKIVWDCMHFFLCGKLFKVRSWLWATHKRWKNFGQRFFMYCASCTRSNCKDGLETTNHLCLHCPIARHLWD